jgi:hypothetical protein
MEKLQSLLTEMAANIAAENSDPGAWRLALLESKTKNRMAYESMLSNLCDDLANRLEYSRWGTG